jgi:hypothetical protein
MTGKHDARRVRFRIEGEFDAYLSGQSPETFADYRPRDLLDLADADRYEEVTVEVWDPSLEVEE